MRRWCRSAVSGPPTGTTREDTRNTAAASRSTRRPTAYQWNYHHNDLGDWCPWTYVQVSARLAGSDDPRCPAGCRDSTVEALPEPPAY